MAGVEEVLGYLGKFQLRVHSSIPILIITTLRIDQCYFYLLYNYVNVKKTLTSLTLIRK